MLKYLQSNLCKLLLVIFMMIGINSSWAQGSENFTNIPTGTSSSYTNRSWTGTNNVIWTATQARTDQTLNGKAICTNGSGTVTSPQYSGGIGTLTFNYVRGFTGTNARTIKVFVNGSQVGSDITVDPNNSNTQAYSSALNISGNVTLELRTSGAQIIIDDISWTSAGPTITTSAASAITASGATLNGSITATTSAVTASFDYGTNSSTYGTSGAATPSSVAASSTASITRTLSGLTPNTQYYFRAVGTVSSTATNGSQAAFYTLANAPGAPVISSPTTTTLTVTLNSTTENSNPSTTTYAIRVGTSQYVTASGTLGTTAVYQTAAAWGSKVVTGLTAATTYTFTPIAQNGAGTTTAGTSADGTTLANTSPGLTASPTSLTGFTYSQNAGPATYQTFSLSGINLTNAPGNITVSCASAAAYEVSLSAASGYTDNLSVTYTSATLASTTIYVRLKAGLTQGTYNSQTINITGGSASTSITASGSVTAPVPANDLCSNATNVVINAAAINGTMVASTNTALTGTNGTLKDVWYKITPSCTGNHTVTVGGFSGDIDIYLYSTSCPTTVTGYVTSSTSVNTPETFTTSLTAGTTYYLRVAAYDTAAESSTFTVQAVSVAAIPTVTASGTSNLVYNGVTISGTATVTGCSSAITAYGVYYSTTNGFSNGSGTQVVGSVTTGNAFSATLTGLTPSTTYYYKTYATNGSGNGYSSQGTFTTPAYIVNAPVATAATGTTASSFIANWEGVSNATSYELEVATTNSFNGTTTIFSDDFESGTLSNWDSSTNWTNTSSSPISGTRSLRINGSGAGTAYTHKAVTYNSNAGTVTWRFLFNFAGSDPSGNNAAWYYLMSNSLNLSSTVADGYVVGVNFGDTSDDLMLWKATDGAPDTQLIAAGIDVDQSITYAVEVTRTPAGVWTLKYKQGTDFTNLTTAGTATNTDYTTNTYHGFVAKYSTSFAASLIKFDNISITQPFSTAIAGYNPKVITSGSVLSDLVTGLTENTTYYYRLRALNSTYSVTSANSNIISVTTGKNLTWNGTQWTGGVTPTIIDSGIINGAYNTATNGNLSLGTLTVNAASPVNVASNTTLTVSNGITNLGDENNFIVQDNGAVLQTITGIANSGAITVHKNSNSLYRQDYTMWSSPATSTVQTLATFAPNTIDTRFYEYDCKLSGSVYSESYYHVDPATTHFAPAHSYLIRMPNLDSTTGYNTGTTPIVVDGKFIGIPNNGTITRTLNTQANRYTSTGNPYPSPIGITEFFNENSSVIDLSSGIYLWRKKNSGSSGSYATINQGSFTFNESNGTSTGGQVNNDYFTGGSASWRLAPGQGFIVKTRSDVAGTPSLTFKNTMRKAAPGSGGQSFFRSGQQSVSRYWINMANAAGNTSQLSVAYMEEGTNGIDYGYDASRLAESNTISMYTIAEEKDLTIQTRPEFTPADVVKAGYVSPEAGTYSIRLSNKEGVFTEGQAIYIKDNTTGVTRELGENNYTFATEAGTFNDRFEIIYTDRTLGTDTPVVANTSIAVYKNNTSIVADAGNDVINSIEVYDIQGRRLFAKDAINATSFTTSSINASHEMLIVKVSTAKGSVSKKIIF